VTKRAPIELAQIMLMLDLLEPQLMRSMARPSNKVIARANELNQRMAEIADDWDHAETLSLNREFHFLLFGQSPYQLVLQEVERLWGLAEPFISQKLSTPQSRHQAVMEHERIIDALAVGDVIAAADALDAHRVSGRHGALPKLHPTN